MTVRGVRGAINVPENTEAAILEATAELLRAIVRRNEIEPQEIAAAFFTATPDLDATFPAEAARTLLGWTDVPLLCAAEMNVPVGMRRVVRVLILINTNMHQDEVAHVYLGEAERLRPDLAPDAWKSV